MAADGLLNTVSAEGPPSPTGGGPSPPRMKEGERTMAAKTIRFQWTGTAPVATSKPWLPNDDTNVVLAPGDTIDVPADKVSEYASNPLFKQVPKRRSAPKKKK